MEWDFSGNPAENYERYLVPAIFVPLAEDLIKVANIQPGERVLDVACGTGIFSRLIAEQIEGIEKIVGIDINSVMLAVARSSQPASDISIEWCEDDVTTLSFSDGSFGVAVCQQGLQFFPDKVVALREIRRVLISGGRLVLNVFSKMEDNPAYTALVQTLERHVSAEAAATRRAIFGLSDADELYELMIDAGYRDIKIETVVRTVRFPSPQEFLRRQLASWKSEVVAGMDSNSRAAMVNEMETALQSYVDDEGLAFPMGTHLAVGYV